MHKKYNYIYIVKHKSRLLIYLLSTYLSKICLIIDIFQNKNNKYINQTVKGRPLISYKHEGKQKYGITLKCKVKIASLPGSRLLKKILSLYLGIDTKQFHNLSHCLYFCTYKNFKIIQIFKNKIKNYFSSTLLLFSHPLVS